MSSDEEIKVGDIVKFLYSTTLRYTDLALLERLSENLQGIIHKALIPYFIILKFLARR